MPSAFWRLARRDDPAQLGLDLADPPPRTAEALLERLRGLGLTRIERCRLTRNRNVMVSFGASALRVHEGYLEAPPGVLRAIVTFVEGRTRAERRAARRLLLAYPVRTTAPAASRRRERTVAADQPLATELARCHERLNAEHFGGRLRAVTVRVSRRMRTRLGHYTPAANGEPAEIAISRRHLRRHGWDEVLHTLLHEMVHQWQDETGRPIDHGPDFRRKAREVGVVPSARRTVARDG